MKIKTSYLVYAVIATVFAGLSMFTDIFEKGNFEAIFSNLGMIIGLSISAYILITMAKSFIDLVINELKKNVQKQGQELNLSMRSKKEFFNITMNDNYDLEIKTLCFKHGQSMLDFEFCEESDGTKRVFDFLDILLNKNQNSVYVIDEMERSLHPNLFNRFIELLNEYQKQSNIQVIFTTHESSIMKQDLFRRDQIWFIERNKDNDSRIYSLDTFNERFDKKISKAYLDGRYGAIPQFKSLHINELE